MKSLNEVATSIFVEELVRQGIRDVFIAPGSRSTPLVIACANNSKIKIHTHFDERGLGFFALGWSKKTKKPSLVITTSGTAVANLLPALVEAHSSYTPMIVCSADRPSELIGVGANQAITQRQIFGDFVSDYFEIQPVDTNTSLENIVTLAAHVAMTAFEQSQPVHINWMFREPLAPIAATGLSDKQVEVPPHIGEWLESKESYVKNVRVSKQSDYDLSFLENTDKNKILIVFGSLIDESEKEDLLKIAEHFNAPVLCDVQNPLRFHEFEQHVVGFDLLLETSPIPDPDIIIHFGGTLTSKNLNLFIEQSNAQYVQVHNRPSRLDFMHKQKTLIRARPKDFAMSLRKARKSETSYLQAFKNFSDELQTQMALEFRETLNELSLPAHLVTALKEADETEMFVGSSMPIRDLERFAGLNSEIRATFNRGASGIDGNIATAVGVAMAANKNMVCVVGDQTFLYDLNSLSLVKYCQKPFHTIVVNNQGGGIFSFLPVAKIESSVLAQLFTHPHEWSVKSAAETFHLDYVRVQTPAELKIALQAKRSSVIEVKTDISSNVKLHRDFTLKMKAHFNRES